MSSLAVKYRPKTFDEVAGQQTTVKILNRQIDTKQYKNAYIFSGASGCGKAQPLDSKVLTRHGFKTMGSICVGDEVFTHKGKNAKVTGVFPQGIRPIYEITLKDNTKISVSDEHLNIVWKINRATKEKEEIVLTTNELIKQFESEDYIFKVETPTVDFEYQNLVIDPYLLGALIGDGALTDSQYRFSNAEQDIVDKIKDKLKIWGYDLVTKNNCDYRLTPIYRQIHLYHYDDMDFFGDEALTSYLSYKGYPKFSKQEINSIVNGFATEVFENYEELKGKITYELIEGYGNDRVEYSLHNIIRKYGLNCKSVDKFIPEAYLLSSKEQRLELLRGLFDTDGYRNNTSEFCTSSKKLSEDFEFLVRSLGMNDRIITRQPTYTYKGEKIQSRYISYRHFIKAPNGICFYSSNKHRKKECIDNFENLRTIINIDYVGEQECQCIYVDDEEHTYISDGFIPTHNTTIARAFSNAVNNGEGKPIEIDAASNNGVDNIRTIIETASERAIDCEYKFVILDEAHQLTTQSWNALLKIIEEPPKYTIFIFCTTEPNKIPQTIQNRCQKFTFTKLSNESIAERLRYICDKENIKYDNLSIDYITKISNGGMRDAINNLEKVISYTNEIEVNKTVEALGSFNYNDFFNLTNNLIDGKDKEVVEQIEHCYNQGNDLITFVNQYFSFIVDIAKYIVVKDMNCTKIPNTMNEQVDSIIKIDKAISYFDYVIENLIELKTMLKNEPDVISTVEVMFLKVCRCK